MQSIAMHAILLEEQEEEETTVCRTVRRQLRDQSNPLELPEPLFQQLYRVNKAAFSYLLDILTTALPPKIQRFGIPPVVKLAACLRFFAEGGYQKGVGNDHQVGLAQSSMSVVLSEVVDVFEKELCPNWITWPALDEQRKISQVFYSKYKLPGVVGCIDGTHVNIISPAVNKHLFYNRKGKFSLNVLLVCDHTLRIRFIDATHPGACHDSMIWNVSDLRSKMESDYLENGTNVWLLGDAGYPLEPWILTPFRNVDSGSVEEKFNDVHSRCRNIVERTNGVLKNRWRCLLGARELYYSPQKAIKIINVGAALHNICIEYKIDTSYITGGLLNETENVQSTESNSSYLSVGQRIRSNIANTLE